MEVAPAVTDEQRQAEIAQRWPDAVATAQAYREVFGDQVRLMYAKNAAGDELKRRNWRR